MPERLDGLLLRVQRVQDATSLRVWIRRAFYTAVELLLHQARVLLQDIVLDEHIALKLAMVLILRHPHVLRRLGAGGRGSLVHHLLRAVLRDEHDAVLAVVAHH